MLKWPNDEEIIRRELQEKYKLSQRKPLQIKGSELRRIRDEVKCVSQPWLEQHSGIDQTTISNYEEGITKTTKAGKLYAMAIALDCNLEDIAVTPSTGLSSVNDSIPVTDFERLSDYFRAICDVSTIIPSWGDVVRDAFYPRTVFTHDQFNHAPIDGVNDLVASHALILGTVGQGKSLLLRRLVVAEFETKSSLPVLLEYRELGREPILAAVVKLLQTNGIRLQQNDLELRLKKGEISLFLDGFNELPLGDRPRAAKELHELCKQFPTTKIIVTSRYQVSLDTLSCLTQHFLRPLDSSNDILGIVMCYVVDEEEYNSFTKLFGSLGPIRKLLTSPLRVVYLLMLLRRKQSIQKTMIDYYRALPDFLINRHNHLNGLPKTPICSQLDSFELRMLLEALSYEVTAKEAVDTTTRGGILVPDFEDMAAAALKKLGLKASPKLALNDLASITDLIFERNSSYFFANPSIQYFNAARFISSEQFDSAEDFYRASILNWQPWRKVLGFLSIIDSDRYLEHFYLPDLQSCAELTVETYLLQYSSMSVFEILPKALGGKIKYILGLGNRKRFCMDTSFQVVLRPGEDLYPLLHPDVAEQVFADLAEDRTAEVEVTDGADGIQVPWVVSEMLEVPKIMTSVKDGLTKLRATLHELLDNR